jgi:hypothetical protein
MVDLSAAVFRLTLTDHLHPDFNDPRQPTIVESGDNVRFCTDLRVLAIFSTFFQDLASLPSPSAPDSETQRPSASHEGEPQVIPLPSATSPALRFILDAINVLDGARLPHECDVSDMDEILEACDAYDLPIVVAQILTLDLGLGRIDRFVLARLCGDELGIKALSGDGQLVTSPTNGISDWGSKHLRRQDPKAFEALQRLNERWSDNLDRFETYGVLLSQSKAYYHRQCRQKYKRGTHASEYRAFVALANAVLWKIKNDLVDHPTLVRHFPSSLPLRKYYNLDSDWCRDRLRGIILTVSAYIKQDSHTIQL